MIASQFVEDWRKIEIRRAERDSRLLNVLMKLYEKEL